MVYTMNEPAGFRVLGMRLVHGVDQLAAAYVNQ